MPGQRQYGLTEIISYHTHTHTHSRNECFTDWIGYWVISFSQKVTGFYEQIHQCQGIHTTAQGNWGINALILSYASHSSSSGLNKKNVDKILTGNEGTKGCILKHVGRSAGLGYFCISFVAELPGIHGKSWLTCTPAAWCPISGLVSQNPQSQQSYSKILAKIHMSPEEVEQDNKESKDGCLKIK